MVHFLKRTKSHTLTHPPITRLNIFQPPSMLLRTKFQLSGLDCMLLYNKQGPLHQFPGTHGWVTEVLQGLEFSRECGVTLRDCHSDQHQKA